MVLVKDFAMVLFSSKILILIILLNGSIFTGAHVSLTFPPARKYNLDYLDSVGSIPPCGMPKGTIKTSLIAGSTFNVTWHLGYSHQGSHRLEILSGNGTQLYMLASELDSNDPTATSQPVRLPDNFTCSDCILRLLRQSAELGNPYYWFWSCGDIEIVPQNKYKETCSGNGTPNSLGRCVCNRGFWGERCSYEDECETNSDCGGGGRGECVDLGGTNLPRRQCFCKAGYIGKKCTKVNQEGKYPLPSPSSLTLETLRSNYNIKPLDPRVILYWRVLEDTISQVEFVLFVNGTSYGAIGWRPTTFDGECTRYPTPANNLQPKFRRAKRQIVNNSTLQDRPFLPPPLHPMACCDVVIGSARDEKYRILDYWSGDISTPREDSLWDGSEDIIAGRGWEKGGVTVLVFRKQIYAKDIRDRWNDWYLDKKSHVIWARGQEEGEYNHLLPSGVDLSTRGRNNPSIPNFYTKDEIKYHGFRGQRGYTSINFVEPKE